MGGYRRVQLVPHSRGRVVVCVVSIMHGLSLSDHRTSHAYDSGTERVGYLPTRQALLKRRAKRREVFGESHEE